MISCGSKPPLTPEETHLQFLGLDVHLRIFWMLSSPIWVLLVHSGVGRWLSEVVSSGTSQYIWIFRNDILWILNPYIHTHTDIGEGISRFQKLCCFESNGLLRNTMVPCEQQRTGNAPRQLLPRAGRRGVWIVVEGCIRKELEKPSGKHTWSFVTSSDALLQFNFNIQLFLLEFKCWLDSSRSVVVAFLVVIIRLSPALGLWLLVLNIVC